jgi:hypothetical protein
MRRFTRSYCCAALALGLVSSHSIAGPLANAASDAFRRLPQSAPPAANSGEPAPAPTDAPAAASTTATPGPTDLVADSATPQPADPATYAEPPTSGGATNGGGVQNDLPSRVPEPGVLWLLGAGVLGLALARRRRK